MSPSIYKILTPEQWQAALERDVFEGAPVDLADGYIHFSTRQQVEETAAKHFKGKGALILVSFNAGNFGDNLKWEPSRGGDLFPHLYAKLDPKLAVKVHDLQMKKDGSHHFPEEY